MEDPWEIMSRRNPRRARQNRGSERQFQPDPQKRNWIAVTKGPLQAAGTGVGASRKEAERAGMSSVQAAHPQAYLFWCLSAGAPGFNDFTTSEQHFPPFWLPDLIREKFWRRGQSYSLAALSLPSAAAVRVWEQYAKALAPVHLAWCAQVGAPLLPPTRRQLLFWWPDTQGIPRRVKDSFYDDEEEDPAVAMLEAITEDYQQFLWQHGIRHPGGADGPRGITSTSFRKERVESVQVVGNVVIL